jgi:pyruvate formate-lyase activating enzyme-like uncharacterized protein
MRKIKSTLAGSKYVGTLPKGCELCIKGLKSVLFITGVCPVNCFYCPLSSYRKNLDKVIINEKEVKNDEEVIKEIELCNSEGAGITGGDPLLRMERTLHYITLLKETFGNKFHLHLYTFGIPNEKRFREALEKLDKAGLDEFRFHLDMEDKKNWNLVKIAMEFSFDVGVEVPCIPDKEEHMKEMVHFLEDAGVSFINLNEFEASELTIEEIQERGYELNVDEFDTIVGSYELGRKMIKYIASYLDKLSAHFCESYVKEYYQLRNRMKLRASNIKREYEQVSEEGWLYKGYVYPKENQSLEQLKDELSTKLRVSRKMLFVNRERGVVETSAKLAVKAAKSGYRAELVWELPADDRFIMQVEPL